jgi:hypothetical protein
LIFTDFGSCTGLQVKGNTAGTGGVVRVTPAIGSRFDNAFGPIGAAATGAPALSDIALAPGALLVAGAGLAALRKRRVFG